jgi:hypothetical protein
MPLHLAPRSGVHFGKLFWQGKNVKFLNKNKRAKKENFDEIGGAQVANFKTRYL